MKRNHDRQEAAELLRRILAAVEQGEIDADSPAARRGLRRLEGAAIGLAAGEDSPAPGADGAKAVGQGRKRTIQRSRRA